MNMFRSCCRAGFQFVSTCVCVCGGGGGGGGFWIVSWCDWLSLHVGAVIRWVYAASRPVSAGIDSLSPREPQIKDKQSAGWMVHVAAVKRNKI